MRIILIRKSGPTYVDIPRFKDPTGAGEKSIFELLKLLGITAYQHKEHGSYHNEKMVEVVEFENFSNRAPIMIIEQERMKGR